MARRRLVEVELEESISMSEQVGRSWRALVLVAQALRSSVLRSDDRAYCAALTNILRPARENPRCMMNVRPGSLVLLNEPAQGGGLPCADGGGTNSESGTAGNILERLWEDGILMAAPKRRVTNARRKRRLYYTKGIVEKKSFTTCQKCSKKHLPHHLCPWCFPFNRWTINKHVKPPNREFK